jgi:hypothetical protein
MYAIVAVAVLAGLAESVATTLKLPAPFVDAVGVPLTTPPVDSFRGVTSVLPLASFQVTVPVPPLDVSWYETATPSTLFGSDVVVILKVPA